jgi:hypothetical protein
MRKMKRKLLQTMLSSRVDRSEKKFLSRGVMGSGAGKGGPGHAGCFKFSLRAHSPNYSLKRTNQSLRD